MLDTELVYAVDYHQELLDVLKSQFDATNITFVKNDGDDFPNIPDGSVDIVFSFGTFVHLDTDIIDRYLRNMKALLKPDATVVLQYSDKTKPLARKHTGFSQNTPDKMRQLILCHGYEIQEEDLDSLPHSAMVRFGLPTQ
jgi:ubiquinone/menaquinone biosynthesis C-methylase UbiE